MPNLSCLQVGPRLELELVKIQEGLASGTVLYHRYEHRSTEQTAAQQDAKEEAQRLRAERRRQQEENVQRKLMEKKREKLAVHVSS
jgi:ribosome biogenesis protein SSF1/2